MKNYKTQTRTKRGTIKYKQELNGDVSKTNKNYMKNYKKQTRTKLRIIKNKQELNEEL